MNIGVYVVAGRDLRRFVAVWLDQVQTADSTQHPIVSAVAEEPDPKQQAFYGGVALMSFIGPRVWGEAGSDEELLLFAVLAVYGLRDDVPWEGYESRVQRAFEFMHEIGEIEAARRLRQEIVDKDKDEEWQTITNLLRGTSHKDPAEIAVHEQEMAKATRRDLRAAAVLDPDGATTFWETLD
jgi:hypothetical protein